MVSHLVFYQLMFLGLLWLCVMLHYAWPNDEGTAGAQRPSKPLPATPQALPRPEALSWPHPQAPVCRL